MPTGRPSLRHSYNFIEVAPPGDPVGTFRLLVPQGGDLAVDLRADFDDDLLGIDPSGDDQVFVHQGRVTAARRLLEAGPPAAAASDSGSAH